MKKLTNLLKTAVFVTFVMNPLFFVLEAQNTTGNTEETIRSLEEKERMGVLNQDFQALEQLWSEHFMVNSPFNRVSSNRGVVLENFRQGLAHYTSFDRNIEHIRIDGEIAIVMGGETVQPTGNAPRAGETVQRRFTHLWKQEGGEWRLVMRHANNIVSD